MTPARSRGPYWAMSFLFIAFLASPVLGFTSFHRHQTMMIAPSSRPTKNSLLNKRSCSPLFMSSTNEFDLTRDGFVSKSLIGCFVACVPGVASAFVGGVGGLGMSL